MSNKKATKLVREGDLVAEVGIELLGEKGGWSPYLSVRDATRLDEVRLALRSGDVREASRLADRVYRLTPVSLTDAR
ncbi:MAG: hypothetical protein NUW01_07970 [Gemmatimonadaceae bacterium]|nr:hypothetical protein [Gemmatimonadaceae bacterium]